MPGGMSMSYQELADAYERLGEPIQAISAFYEQARSGMERATSGGGLASTIEADAFRKALDIAPPGADDRLARVMARLDLGPVVAGEQIIAPWSAFLDAQAVKPLDATTWKYFGFGQSAARAAKPFRTLMNVPAEVVADQNLAMLREVAAGSKTLKQLTADAVDRSYLMPITSFYTLHPDHMNKVPVPPPDDTTSTTGSTQQALAPQDFTGAADCLQKAKWSFTSWGFVLTCCMDRACADTLESLLGLGIGTLLGGALALFTKGIAAAVSAVGGWVALGIILSCFYWAAMIHFNKTPRGVCLNIPMPWSFGVVGPGWATGI